MGEIVTLANTAFRDYATDGVRASGKHKPQKTAIRAVFSAIEAALPVNAATAGLALDNSTDDGADLFALAEEDLSELDLAHLVAFGVHDELEELHRGRVDVYVVQEGLAFEVHFDDASENACLSRSVDEVDFCGLISLDPEVGLGFDAEVWEV